MSFNRAFETIASYIPGTVAYQDRKDTKLIQTWFENSHKFLDELSCFSTCNKRQNLIRLEEKCTDDFLIAADMKKEVMSQLYSEVNIYHFGISRMDLINACIRKYNKNKII
jgi:hypothetical protein